MALGAVLPKQRFPLGRWHFFAPCAAPKAAKGNKNNQQLDGTDLWRDLHLLDPGAEMVYKVMRQQARMLDEIG
jgi:hypothetical protein